MFKNLQWPTNKIVILVAKKKKKNPQNTRIQDKSNLCLGQMSADSHPENKLIHKYTICSLSIKYCTRAILSKENSIFHSFELQNGPTFR